MSVKLGTITVEKETALFFCDVCGAEIGEAEGVWCSAFIAGSGERMDLCVSCSAKVEEFIEGMKKLT